MSAKALDYTRKTEPVLLNRSRADSVLQDAGLDAIIATSPENVSYVSSYQCMSHWLNKGTLVFAVLPRDSETDPTIITPALEIDGWAEAPSWIRDIRLYGTSAYTIGREIGCEPNELLEDDQLIYELAFREREHPSALQVLAEYLEEQDLDGGRIGLDETGVSHTVRRQIIDLFPRAEVVDAADVLRRIRMVKTPAEVERLAKATEITANALAAVMDYARPGMTERELFQYYATHVTREGATAMVNAFACVNAGRRSGHPHPIPSDYSLQEGDVVKYDLGCTYGFYYSDIARIQVIGGANQEQRKIYDALLAGEQAGIDMLRPGVRPSEIFETTVSTVRESGLPNYRRHHVGHGIGIEIYDPPLIQPATASSELSGLGTSNEPLEAGMVINIETPYYVLGKYGLTVEDTVLVTSDGPEYLSNLPRELL